MMQKVKGFVSKKKSSDIMRRKLEVLKMENVTLCDTNIAKQILKKQTTIDMNPNRVGLIATMLSLSISGLALATTRAQIESLRQDSDTLFKEIAALSSGSGRSYPRQFEDLKNEEAEILMGITFPFLKVVNFQKDYFCSIYSYQHLITNGYLISPIKIRSF